MKIEPVALFFCAHVFFLYTFPLEGAIGLKYYIHVFIFRIVE